MWVGGKSQVMPGTEITPIRINTSKRISDDTLKQFIYRLK